MPLATFRPRAAEKQNAVNGSSTYGQEFGNNIQHRYPGDDHRDLMAGVDELIRRGWADPPRLSVTGGSSGGLARC